MKRTELYGLMALIVVAPHLSEFWASIFAVVCLVCSAVSVRWPGSQEGG